MFSVATIQFISETNFASHFKKEVVGEIKHLIARELDGQNIFKF